MAIVDTHSKEAHTLQLMYREPKFPHFRICCCWTELIIIDEMKDQINAGKILHSSAIYIQSMKITRSLCKKLLINDQKCQMFFLHLVQHTFLPLWN